MYDFIVCNPCICLQSSNLCLRRLVVYYFTFHAKRIYVEGKELLLKIFIQVLIYFP